MNTAVRAVLLLCLFVSTPAFAETDEQLAMRFYPQSLDELFIRTHDPETPVVRRTTLLRVDLDGSGFENYLAVAYSNGLAAELFLISGFDSAAAVVDQADEPLGGRGIPVLEAIDIENDGIPELAVGFMRETWLYKFENGALALFGPKQAAESGEITNLGTAAYFDLDGDGVLEIFEEAPPTAEATYIVHKLEGSDFARTPTEIMFFDRFEQVEGLAVSERQFEAPAGDYQLRVLTVAPQQDPSSGFVESEPVVRGQVTLNGAVVSGGGGGEDLISVDGSTPVSLQSLNTLQVELPTESDTYIYIVISRTN